ncbi:type I-E CRISPR-associated protein Cse1/CasA [Proteiniclasticum sp. QWL-01]|uniref:type I-E CRISPR-associated protein Cse1/CasA n=1 Tax=Proteiniclasticum sp. QWL-01 TaxID=3036945 RepID=UPI00240F439D|nr:type I-E CRISPR-associated protein Cse1/CasA [Proteiniclasticum sp. QWL-01]WFF72820.1 type I-E CRISPR-associated protein Cse1/CasA [Proteiniclasticum sp. QWL-01]
MLEIEFNLLEEPWIMVLNEAGQTLEVSIKDAFQNAHRYIRLAGETPTQNISITRMLLAILHSTLGRDFPQEWLQDSLLETIEDTSIKEFLDTDLEVDPLQRWSLLWKRGSFPMELMMKYFTHYWDRFYLFHPTHPFYQVPGMKRGTAYQAAKLNGELSESNNKVRLFPSRSGQGKQSLSYNEAARWLLHVNNFDDTASKSTEKLASPGAGWLGQTGSIYAEGRNLFESLLLNFILCDSSGTVWPEGRAIWERPVQAQERREIPLPENQADLLTLQSRRLLLQRTDDKVTGYILLGGDYFKKDNAFSENFTLWRRSSTGKKDDPINYVPKRHDPARQLWRDFASLLVAENGDKRPGIVNWLTFLKVNNVLENRHCYFQSAAIQYGDKDFFANDIIEDSLSFSSQLLDQMNSDWITGILEEIKHTENLIKEYGYLARRIALASGDSTGESQEMTAKEQGYFTIDPLFRNWLRKIEPVKDDLSQVSEAWWKIAQSTIRRMGKELVSQAGSGAIIGRTVKLDKQEKHYSSLEAYNDFIYRTSKPR